MNKIIILKKRKDFLRAAKGVRMVVSTAILQAARSLSEEEVPFKIGFTASKKIGKAHIRSRAKRRLRAVVREVFPELALPNVEYVLISRFNTAYCSYQTLKSDIKWALKKANKILLAEDQTAEPESTALEDSASENSTQVK